MFTYDGISTVGRHVRRHAGRRPAADHAAFAKSASEYRANAVGCCRRSGTARSAQTGDPALSLIRSRSSTRLLDPLMDGPRAIRLIGDADASGVELGNDMLDRLRAAVWGPRRREGVARVSPLRRWCARDLAWTNGRAGRLARSEFYRAAGPAPGATAQGGGRPGLGKPGVRYIDLKRCANVRLTGSFSSRSRRTITGSPRQSRSTRAIARRFTIVPRWICQNVSASSSS